jgi:hypothetical protein
VSAVKRAGGGGAARGWRRGRRDPGGLGRWRRGAAGTPGVPSSLGRPVCVCVCVCVCALVCVNVFIRDQLTRIGHVCACVSECVSEYVSIRVITRGSRKTVLTPPVRPTPVQKN